LPGGARATIDNPYCFAVQWPSYPCSDVSPTASVCECIPPLPMHMTGRASCYWRLQLSSALDGRLCRVEVLTHPTEASVEAP
jgi:hypothetical protein